MSDEHLEIFALSDFNDPYGALALAPTGQQWAWLDPQTAALELTGQPLRTLALSHGSAVFSDDCPTEILTRPITLDGTTYPAGTEVKDAYEATFTGSDGGDYLLVALAMGGRIVAVNFAGPTPPVGATLTYAGQNYSRAFADGLPGFSYGIEVDTPDGPRPVSSLRPGDLVMTRDHGPQPLRWLSSSRQYYDTPQGEEGDRPIMIGADALGPGQPMRKSTVRPDMRIAPASSLPAAPESLVGALPAEAMLSQDNIWRKRRCREMVWVHLIFDQSECLFSHGLMLDCPQPDTTTLNALRRAALLPPVAAAEDQPEVSHLFSQQAA